MATKIGDILKEILPAEMITEGKAQFTVVDEVDGTVVYKAERRGEQAIFKLAKRRLKKKAPPGKRVVRVFRRDKLLRRWPKDGS